MKSRMKAYRRLQYCVRKARGYYILWAVLGGLFVLYNVYEVRTRRTAIKFSLTNHSHPVFTLHSVCIEESATPYTDFRLKFPLPGRKLVSYQAPRDWTDNVLYIQHDGIFNNPGYFVVEFRDAAVPRHYVMYNDTEALITATTAWPGNLYHFWNDLYLPLFAAFKYLNLLDSERQHDLYYWHAHRLLRVKKYNYEPWTSTGDDPDRFGAILKSLPIKSHDDLPLSTPGICYRTCHFVKHTSGTPNDFISARDHVISKFGIQDHACDKVNVTVTLMQRQTDRRILNIDKLKDELVKSGYENVEIAMNENKTLLEQMQTAHCSDIIIGVNGAALTWVFFQKYGGAFLEIYWQNWPPFFGVIPKFKRPDILHYTAEASSVLFKNESFFFFYFVRNTPRNALHLAKSADIQVDTANITRIVKMMANGLCRDCES